MDRWMEGDGWFDWFERGGVGCEERVCLDSWVGS
jgi:hypothetical protein